MAGEVLVTGGTGKTGRRVAEALAARGVPARIATREPRGPGQVRFDWGDASTWDDARAGISAAYLVAPAGEFDLLAAMRPFVDRLIEGGAGRLVLLSAAQLPSGGPMMGAVHAYLAERAPRWTVLRPTFFMQNFSEQQHRATILDEDAVYSAAGDGRVGWIDAGDIAAVATAALTDPGRANGDLVLTGPRTLNYDEIAEIIGAAAGRRIAHRRLGVDALAERYAGGGLPPDYARTLAGMDAEIAAGGSDFTTGAVLETAGEPTGFETFAARNRDAWSPEGGRNADR